MAFKFYLDGQLTDQPMNDKELSTTIKRDNTLNTLTITQDVDLSYNGNNNLEPNTISGYSYLKGLFENQLCNEVEIVIYDDLVHIYTGVIKIPSVRIDYQQVVLSTKVQDKGFYSYINNNKSIKVNLASEVTKSNDQLDPITWYKVDLFTQIPTIGCAYGAASNYFYKGFLIQDVFAFVISYISDNKLKFKSDFLDSLDNQVFLFSGQALANSYTYYPSAQEPVIEITFSDLFNELSKIFNLILWIDAADPQNPIVKIETKQLSYENDLNYEFKDVKELKSSVDVSSLYAIVETGSSTFVEANAPFYAQPYPAGRDYFSWKIETYNPIAQCNIDTRLDIVNNWIIDTNIIAQALNLSATDYFGDIFLIECSNIDSVNLEAQGHQYDFFGDGSCFYNWNLNNYNKLQRYSNEFENAFGSGFASVQNGFRASLQSDIILEANPTLPLGGIFLQPTPAFPPQTPIITLIEPVIYNDVTTGINYNNNGNYNTATGIYTIPVNGLYSFIHTLDFQLSGIYPPSGVFSNLFFIDFGVRHYDSSNNLIYQSGRTLQYGPSPIGGLNQVESFTVALNAVATDYVQAFIRMAYITSQPIPVFTSQGIQFNVSSFFECNGSPGGGLTPTTGTSQAKKYFFEFEYEIPQSDWLQITANTTKMVSIEKDGITRFGWIDTMKHNDWNGMTQIKLITNNATTTQ